MLRLPFIKTLRMTSVLLMLLTFVVSAPVFAAGTNYYVSPSGSDSNSGTSLGSPFQTIQKAVDLAQPGDTINLASGTYNQDILSRRNGTASAPITLTGPSNAIIKGGGNGRVFEINHDYLTLDGFTMDGRVSSSSYRDKLVFAIGTEVRDGVSGLRVLNMTFRNAGGECLRLRYFAQNNEIAYSTFLNCGQDDYPGGEWAGGGKNGEAIYIGTSNNQWGDGKNPTNEPDQSNNNWVHNNFMNTQGNECVDVKEGSTGNIIEYNECTGQKDENSAGLNSRGDGNTFRYNETYGNVGGGVRLGGALVDGEQYGKNNDVYDNLIYDNIAGGVKFMVTPQGKVCGNTMSNNTGGDSFGDFADQFDPKAPCSGSTGALEVASVTASNDDGNGAANTLDNNLSTRWSAQGDGEWIRYDLGGTKTISYVDIAFHKGDQRVADFQIQVSNTTSNWTTVFTGSSNGNTTVLQTFDFADINGRYVRIVGFGNTQNNWNSLTEVDIYGAS